MEKFKEFEDIVQSTVEKLNNKWFGDKLKQFRSHPMFDNKQNEIIFNESTVGLMSKKNQKKTYFEEIELPDRVINFIDYCSLYEPLERDATYYGQFKFIENPARVNIEDNLKDYAEELIDELCSLVNPKDNSEVYSFIGNTLDIIQIKSKEQMALLNSDDYKFAIFDFIDHCQDRLNWKFRKELMLKAVNSTELEKSTLAFNLTKPADVMALVHILIKSGLTFHDDFEELCYFVFKHFSYYDNKNDRIVSIASNMNNLKTYYKRITETENINSLVRIKAMLNEYLKDIKD